MTADQPADRQITPDVLVAILVAARRSGDRQLERLAKRELLDRHGIRIAFAAPAKEGRR